MEQFFVIIAIVVFWIFRGVAGARRQAPGRDPYDLDSSSPGGPRDIAGATRQKTVEAQQVALEALQRWEAKQRLSSGYGGPAQAAPGPESVPAASRTRVGRPADTGGRPAKRHRKDAYAEIARMLGRETAAPSRPVPEAAKPSVERRPSDAALRRDSVRKDEAAHKEAAAQKDAAAQREVAAYKGRPTGKGAKAGTHSILASIETMPLAARAIVYSEILGRPRSLS